MTEAALLFTDGWRYHPWLYPCDRCGSTKYAVRSPGKYCDICITPKEYTLIIDSQDFYAE